MATGSTAMTGSNPPIHATLAELVIPLGSVTRYPGNARRHDGTAVRFRWFSSVAAMTLPTASDRC